MPIYLNGEMTVMCQAGQPLRKGRGHPLLLGDFDAFWAQILRDVHEGRAVTITDEEDICFAARLPWPQGAAVIVLLVRNPTGRSFGQESGSHFPGSTFPPRAVCGAVVEPHVRRPTPRHWQLINSRPLHDHPPRRKSDMDHARATQQPDRNRRRHGRTAGCRLVDHAFRLLTTTTRPCQPPPPRGVLDRLRA